jgi:hypothetical protein
MTEQPEKVTVSGGKGVVVGDYATVFQSFVDPLRPVSAMTRAGHFRLLVEERAKGFVGREFVFEALEHAMQQSTSGYVIIRGEPGIGKTALASVLVIRGGYVHHFNVAPENIRSPRQFLENVCAQLILRYDLDHATLPAQAGEDAGFLSQLLMEAVDKAQERGELPVVVVVDALDETLDTGLAASANRLYLPRALPEHAFFVVTTREEADDRLDVDNATEIWIRDDDPRNEQDVRRYIDDFLTEKADVMSERLREWDLEGADFVEEVTKRSEGNFMYLVYVLPEIARGRLTAETVGTIDGLPRGLNGYYKRHWRDMRDEDNVRFTTLQRPVLCYLAVGREPITISQLTEWTHLDPAEVMGVVKEWRAFLNEDLTSKPPKYRLHHRSFAEFLDNEENLSWYHGEVATTALVKIPGFAESDTSTSI